MNNDKKDLFSDGKSLDDICKLHNLDEFSVIFNMYEDILCLKEDLANKKSCIVLMQTEKGEL